MNRSAKEGALGCLAIAVILAIVGTLVAPTTDVEPTFTPAEQPVARGDAPGEIAPPRPRLEVDAAAMSRMFGENEVAAFEEYRDRLINVTGEVSTIELEGEQPFVLFKGAEDGPLIRTAVNPLEQPDLSELRPGSTATAYCNRLQLVLGEPVLEGCTL